MTRGDCAAISGADGIVIHLKVENFEGAVRLDVDQKTVLKYRMR